MERKPQQQTLSIRISESLRTFLELSKGTISAARGEPVSISDVAKLLLESAKDDRLDFRLEVAELEQQRTESMVAIRNKWAIAQPLSRAEWIFLAHHIQVACEELTGDPLAPRGECFAVLLEAVLGVRSLRTGRGTELDRYYLGNLINRVWNERQLDPDLVPEVVRGLIEECRASPTCKKAAPAGRCFYVAIRDEAFQDVAALNSILQPYMDTLFRLAARGHWIKERRPIRICRAGCLMPVSLPIMKRGSLTLTVHSTNDDLAFEIEVEPCDLVYSVKAYPQIREFNALLTSLTIENTWTGVAFHAVSSETAAGPIYRVRRIGECATIRFNAKDWSCLQELFAEALTHPGLQVAFSELSLIYGEL